MNKSITYLKITKAIIMLLLLLSGTKSSSQNVGINTQSPSQKLEVNGKIKISDDNSVPSAGTIRWNSTTSDFEGYDGNIWKSLTKSSVLALGNGTVTENQRTYSVDLQTGDNFGWQVSIDGDLAAIASPGANSLKGAVYVFSYSGENWIQEAKLIAPDAALFDNFARSLSLSGTTIVVGSPYCNIGNNDKQGAVYIWKKIINNWVYQTKLTANDGNANDNFGTSVGIKDNTLIVGAPNDGTGSTNFHGSAYIFTNNGSSWTQTNKLLAADFAADDYFGLSVSITSNRCIIGAPYKKVNNLSHQGAVYTFHKSGSTWIQNSKLTASDALSEDFFGNDVDIDGDYAIIGASKKNIPNLYFDAGGAYLFKYNGSSWSEHSIIESPEIRASEEYGTSVSINGSFILIGCLKRASSAGAEVGAAYLYNFSTTQCNFQYKLMTSDGQPSDSFGTVGLSNGKCIIGAWGCDYYVAGSNKGAVYFFTQN